MATFSSYRVIMGKTASLHFLSCFWIRSFFILAGNDDIQVYLIITLSLGSMEMDRVISETVL